MTATIGSSDVAAILGLSPWQTPLETWARLTGLVPRYTATDTPSQRRGRIMEGALLAALSDELGGVSIVRGPAIHEEPWVAPPPYEWAHARPDGWHIASDGLRFIDEAKTARRFSEEEWGEDGSDGVPVYYAAQVVWQMGVANLAGRGPFSAAYLVAFSPMTDDFRVYRVEHDEARFRGLLEAVRSWRERHVLTGDPPRVHAADLPLLARVFPGRDCRRTLPPTDADRATARALADARRRERTAKATGDLLQAQLCERMVAHAADAIEGIARWPAVAGKRGLDADALAVAHPDIIERFTRQGPPTRRFWLTCTPDTE